VQAAAEGAMPKTVERIGELYIWRTSAAGANGDADSSWIVQGSLAKADMDFPLQAVLQNQGLALLRSASETASETESDNNPEAPGFVPWWVAPVDGNSALTLSTGSLHIVTGGLTGLREIELHARNRISQVLMEVDSW
jgi:hypothetical protein